jgi:hypothetical protein
MRSRKGNFRPIKTICVPKHMSHHQSTPADFRPFPQDYWLQLQSPDKIMVRESIPPELWLSIFRSAAAEPRDIFGNTPIDMVWSGTRPWLKDWFSEHDPQYRARKRTRTALVLVSKYWRSLATEILYECVFLTEEYMLRSFSRTLEDDWQAVPITYPNRQSCFDGPRHIGERVRCLHIDFSKVFKSHHRSAEIQLLSSVPSRRSHRYWLLVFDKWDLCSYIGPPTPHARGCPITLHQRMVELFNTSTSSYSEGEWD